MTKLDLLLRDIALTIALEFDSVPIDDVAVQEATDERLAQLQHAIDYLTTRGAIEVDADEGVITFREEDIKVGVGDRDGS